LILNNKKTFTKEQKNDLWESYAKNRKDKKVFNDLVEAYLPLLEVLALKSKSKLPPEIEVGDLVSDGFFGLVDAIEKFDPDKGFKFETYATNRIQGEINTGLRNFDWISRYSRLKFKLVSQTEDALFEALQRQPTTKDIAERLGWREEEVLEIQSQYIESFNVNIDEYISDSTHESFSLREFIPDSSASEIGFDLEMDEMSTVLEKSLFSLDEQESIIVFLYIYEEKKLNEIAAMLDINIKQVSKMYDDALKKLQDQIHVI